MKSHYESRDRALSIVYYQQLIGHNVFNQSVFFFFFWQHFVALLGLALAAGEGAGGCSSLECMDFSWRWLPCCGAASRACGLQHSSTWVSTCGVRVPGHTGFTTCGACALWLRSLWNLFGPGIELMSPAPAGGFLSTEPPTKFPMSF